jgi:broad specificity phosphatase PhoE
MPPTLFLLVCHAESIWNAEERWQGHADPPLSPTGRSQAEAAARLLADTRLGVLLSSDLTRAMQTAVQVGAPHGLSPQPDPRLRELDVGSWSGLTQKEIEELDPDTLARFAASDPDARPGGGETRREIRQRVRRAMVEIAETFAGRRVGVVTHLGVIRALLPGTELGNAEWVFASPGELAAP